MEKKYRRCKNTKERRETRSGFKRKDPHYKHSCKNERNDPRTKDIIHPFCRCILNGANDDLKKSFGKILYYICKNFVTIEIS